MRYFDLKHAVPDILKVSEVAQIAKQILRQAKGKISNVLLAPDSKSLAEHICDMLPPPPPPTMLLGKKMHVENLHH